MGAPAIDPAEVERARAFLKQQRDAQPVGPPKPTGMQRIASDAASDPAVQGMSSGTFTPNAERAPTMPGKKTYGEAFTERFMPTMDPAVSGTTRYLIDNMPWILSTAATLPFGGAPAGAPIKAVAAQAGKRILAAGAGAVAGEVAQKATAGELPTKGDVATSAALNMGGQTLGEAASAAALYQRAFKKLGGKLVTEATEVSNTLGRLATQYRDILVEKTGMSRGAAERVAKTKLTAAQMTNDRLIDEMDNFVKSSWVGGRQREKLSRGLKDVVEQGLNDTVEALGPHLEADDVSRLLGQGIKNSKNIELQSPKEMYTALSNKMRVVHAPEVEPGLAGPMAPGGLAKAGTSVTGVRSRSVKVGEREVPGTGGLRVTGNSGLVSRTEEIPGTGGFRVTGVGSKPNPPRSVMDPTKYESGLAGPGVPRGIPIIEGGGTRPVGGRIEAIPAETRTRLRNPEGVLENVPPTREPVMEQRPFGGRSVIGRSPVIVEETGSQAGLVNLRSVDREALNRNFKGAGTYDSYIDQLAMLDEHVPGKAEFQKVQQLRSDLVDAIQKSEASDIGQGYDAKFIRVAKDLHQQLTKAMENAAKDYDAVMRTKDPNHVSAHALMKDADLAYRDIMESYHPNLVKKLLMFGADSPNAPLNAKTIIADLENAGTRKLTDLRRIAGGEKAEPWRAFREMVVSTALQDAAAIPGVRGNYNATKLLDFVNNKLGPNASEVVFGTHKKAFVEGVNALELLSRRQGGEGNYLAHMAERTVILTALTAAESKMTGYGRGEDTHYGRLVGIVAGSYALTTMGLARMLASPATTELLINGVKAKAGTAFAASTLTKILGHLVEGEDYIKVPKAATPAEYSAFRQAAR